jgi:hypothetical protein
MPAFILEARAQVKVNDIDLGTFSQSIEMQPNGIIHLTRFSQSVGLGGAC